MKKTHFSKILAEQGLSPADVAVMGIPYGTVLSHYYGTREMSLKTARRYATALNVPLSKIVDDVCETTLSQDRQEA